MSAILHLQGLRVGFGDAPDVLAGFDLTVQPGEFVTLIGPSGCGKSTVLNVTAGLLTPRAGDAEFAGESITGVNTGVGYMTQEDTLLPWRTVVDNVAMPLRMRQVDRREIDQRVAQYLELLDLADAGRKFPAQLSGGMKRRALLARSMIYRPELLLMDEPFAALDAQLRTQMHVELRRTIRELGQTVLFVTHDIDEAALLSDRVIVLGGGPPASTVTEVAISFGPDRDVEELKFTDEFGRTERELHRALQQARVDDTKAAS